MDDILVFSDKSKEEFKDLLSLYQYKVSNSSLFDINNFKLVIIDLNEENQIVLNVNSIRNLNKGIPIIILSSIEQNFHWNILTKLNGEGIIKIFSLKNSNKDRLIQIIDNLLDRNYSHENFYISFIIPIYNEEKRFANTLVFTKKIIQYIEENYPKSKLIFVNDGSEDLSALLLEKLIEDTKNKSQYISDSGFISLKSLKKNTRKAGTYIEGLKNASGDIIVIADGDNSFFIEDINKMINILQEGYFDGIFATKDLTAENRPFIRKILSFIKRILTKPLLPLHIYDSQTGLKALKGDIINYILPYLSHKRELAIDLEIAYICKLYKLRLLQLPVKCLDREGSHINVIKDSIKYLKNLISIFFTKYDIGGKK